MTQADMAAPPLQLLDRDLSWLEFNRRVLHEAIDPRTPLLERVKFLAIFSANLDEFFMKRVDRLKELAAASTTANGSGPHELERLRQAIIPLLSAQSDVYFQTIRPALGRQGIHLLDWTDLDEPQRDAALQHYRRNVFPILTPLLVDPSHPFPFISNLSVSLGVLQRAPHSTETRFARVKVPGSLPQWVALPDRAGDATGGKCFVKLLDIVANNLGELFPGMEIVEVMPFRVTRNAEVELDDELPESLVKQVEEGLRQRRLEPAVRLEYGPHQSPAMLRLLTQKLGLTDVDVYWMPELDYSGLWAIVGLNRPELHDPPWQPLVPAAFADDSESIFTALRQEDVLVHHPYESFDASVARFIRAAADDPKVVALKMTVYRIGSETHFIDALIRAAETGKQVACLVEVTARFDEQQNLRWAQELERVGVHVVYGVLGLKTHTKVALAVRHDEDGLRAYAHIGTGNYHIKTARLYTDLGLLTCDPALTNDVVNLFHYLTGGARGRYYQKLLVAPVTMRQRFLEMIERETAHHLAGRPARIIAKMNQLEDKALCAALVQAAGAGLSIDLIVRGFCLLPPMPNIRITSIIGRFLEHSRVYYFQNGAAEPTAGEFYIGSADWMQRNLSDRVEAIAPVEAPPLRERLWEFLQIMLNDQRQAWDMQPDGSYIQRTPAPGATGPAAIGTQQAMMDLTRQRQGAT